MNMKPKPDLWLRLAFAASALVMGILGTSAARASSGQLDSQAPNPPPEAAADTQRVFLPVLVRGSAGSLLVNHAGTTLVYENGSSCATCHASEALAAHQSNHYQWDGKLGSINDFCGYPDINFIGILTNLQGNQVDGGCAVCHAGMGAKPDQGGVENVDCMMCHSPDYQRKVTNRDGLLRFQPKPGKLTVSSPNRQTCLRCHIGAGGGPNNKRGDLEPAHINPPSASFDVHMAAPALGGAGLVCIDCHVTESHKIAGRGADLRIDEGAPMKRCADCHSSAPHNSSQASGRDLNQHTARVACESCHIPEFARIQSTDMLRDFRSTEVDTLKYLYEPKLTRQANVTPAYAFWNGGTTFYNFGAPAFVGASLAAPQGGINDSGSKLFPFKLHQAIQAHDPVSGKLLPVKAGILFQTGDVDRAIRQGALDAGIALPLGYDFIQTQRYMGIFHEVAPADQALACDSCHAVGATRVPFESLGYTPKSTRSGRALCTSCHEPENEDWPPDEFFYRVHDQHVDEEHLACTECHEFTR